MSKTQIAAEARAVTQSGAKTATIAASVLIGALFIYLVGFLPVEAMHNYAHDTRHSITAPCH